MCFCVHDSVATRGQYLVLSKSWQYSLCCLQQATGRRTIYRLIHPFPG